MHWGRTANPNTNMTQTWLPLPLFNTSSNLLCFKLSKVSAWYTNLIKRLNSIIKRWHVNKAQASMNYYIGYFHNQFIHLETSQICYIILTGYLCFLQKCVSNRTMTVVNIAHPIDPTIIPASIPAILSLHKAKLYYFQLQIIIFIYCFNIIRRF